MKKTKFWTFLINFMLCTSIAFAAAPIFFEGDYGRLLTTLGIKFSDGKEIRTISVDPGAGGGTEADTGSLALRDSGVLYIKDGGTDTDWSELVTASSALSTALTSANIFVGNGS